MDLAQAGDSLLEHPTVDAAIKVYRGGGMEQPSEREYDGVTGKVARHQVSLLPIPAEKKEMKIYQGGGEKDVMFRGQRLDQFMQNKQFYESLKETGKYYLDTLSKNNELLVKNSADAILKGDASKKPEGKTAKGKGIESNVLQGDSEESLKVILDAFNVFFYAGDTSRFHYTSQLLFFSTVLLPKTRITEDHKRQLVPVPQYSSHTLGFIQLLVNDQKWKLSEAEEIVKEEPVKQIKKDRTIFIGPYWVRDPELLTYTSFFNGLTKGEIVYMEDVIFKGYPYSFLSDIFNNERYQVGERTTKEDFFELVWKPMIENNVMDDLTLQFLSNVRAAREFIKRLYHRQEEKINNDLDEYIHGFISEKKGAVGEEEEWVEEEEKEEEAVKEAVELKENKKGKVEEKVNTKENKKVKVEEKVNTKENKKVKVEEKVNKRKEKGKGKAKKVNDEEWKESDESEPEGEPEDETEGEPEDETEGESEGEPEGEAKGEGENEDGTNDHLIKCPNLLKSTDKNPYIQYIKNIFTLLDKLDPHNSMFDDTIIKELIGQIKTIQPPEKEIEGETNKDIKEGIEEVIKLTKEFVESLEKLLKVRSTQKTSPQKIQLPHFTKQNTSRTILIFLNNAICSLYDKINELGPEIAGTTPEKKVEPVAAGTTPAKGGFRKTKKRRLI
jgi:hypothetical protein